jgi:hypothetical protein
MHGKNGRLYLGATLVFVELSFVLFCGCVRVQSANRVFTIRPGKFNHPRGIACQRATRLVVVGDENDRLQVLRFTELPAPTLTYVSTFGRTSANLPATAPGAKRDGGRSDALGFFRRPAGRFALGFFSTSVVLYLFF